MNIALLKKEIKNFGLSRLSQKTGIARSFLYRIVNEESVPTIEVFEKILSALGFELVFKRKQIEDSVFDVTTQVARGHDWKTHYFNFVDAFRKTKDLQLIAEPPAKGLNKKEAALISSIVLDLCHELSVKPPAWAKERKTLENPWFVAGLENLKAIALAESSPYYKINNIYVLDNFLNRA